MFLHILNMSSNMSTSQIMISFMNAIIPVYNICLYIILIDSLPEYIFIEWYKDIWDISHIHLRNFFNIINAIYYILNIY